MRIYSVTEFREEINELLEQITVVIEGEIKEFNVSQNRFVWFTISDEDTSVKCFMMAFQLKVALEDGMQVRLTGSPTTFRKGQYVFRPRQVQLVGEGTLKQEYERLKQQLHKEGLFDEDRKRRLPRFPKRIGLVTSSDAAAYTDFLRILNNRWGGVEIIHAPVQVQGQRAVQTITTALSQLNQQYPDLDAVVVTRGGGSMEDLHAFNDEEVVRAIFASKIPVVCGVGHERDITLSDLVADVRASTPSNAAELLVPTREDVLAEIAYIESHMERIVLNTVQAQQNLVSKAIHRLEQQLRIHATHFQTLDEQLRFYLFKFSESVAIKKQRISSIQQLLHTVHPEQLLRQGYSILRNQDGQVISSISAMTVGDTVFTQHSDGTMNVEVKSIDRKV